MLKHIKQISKISDEELKQEYYNVVLRCIGSESELMQEIYPDCIDDILDCQKQEKSLSKYENDLREECEKRGIKLWEKQKWINKN